MSLVFANGGKKALRVVYAFPPAPVLALLTFPRLLVPRECVLFLSPVLALLTFPHLLISRSIVYSGAQVQYTLAAADAPALEGRPRHGLSPSYPSAPPALSAVAAALHLNLYPANPLEQRQQTLSSPALIRRSWHRAARCEWTARPAPVQHLPRVPAFAHPRCGVVHFPSYSALALSILYMVAVFYRRRQWSQHPRMGSALYLLPLPVSFSAIWSSGTLIQARVRPDEINTAEGGQSGETAREYPAPTHSNTSAPIPDHYLYPLLDSQTMSLARIARIHTIHRPGPDPYSRLTPSARAKEWRACHPSLIPFRRSARLYPFRTLPFSPSPYPVFERTTANHSSPARAARTSAPARVHEGRVIRYVSALRNEWAMVNSRNSRSACIGTSARHSSIPVLLIPR
ncbi:hypothetical protein B0H14DRAFT_3866490 [Mycena olivaceomarginata]|nr:hypothetical protein B0H14DRAFT_3866490 [Mycena olivaceomarginata]